MPRISLYNWLRNGWNWEIGAKVSSALRFAKDPRCEPLPCTHKGTSADGCLVQRVTQHKCYLVTTFDWDLNRRIRKIRGVPTMYIPNHRYNNERMPDNYGALGFQFLKDKNSSAFLQPTFCCQFMKPATAWIILPLTHLLCYELSMVKDTLWCCFENEIFVSFYNLLQLFINPMTAHTQK